MLPFIDIFQSVSIWSFLAILAAPLIVSSVDFIVLTRTRLVKAAKHSPDTSSVHDFTILIPIFGHIRYLKNVEFLKPYASHVVLCTTDRESAEFNHDIETAAAKYGFRIFRSGLVHSARTSKPNPWRLFKSTLAPQSPAAEILKDSVRDEIIRNSFTVVDSGYCIFIDGDTYVKEDLSKLVGLMNEKGYDLASVRVVASKQDTIMEKLQSIEYELAMDARRIYPWLTSGAGMVAKTSVIKDIMAHHSLFFSGGDIEIGKLARLLGYHVGHLSIEFFTDVPSTFKAWFKQRIAWCGGGFRHAVINFHSFSWKNPFFFFYTTIIVYLLTPLRWWEIAHTPQILPLIIVLYWILITIFHFRTWKPYYLLFPFYSLIQVMIIVPLGAFAYLSMVHRSRNIGLIKLRFPHPFSSTTLRELHLSKLLLMLGSTILFYFFSTQLITSLLFFFRIPVSPFHFPVSLICTSIFTLLFSLYIFKSRWILFSLINLIFFLGVFIGSTRLANRYFDISYDGNAYHQAAVLKLVSGWDPIYRYVTREEVGGVDRWLNHYSKGAWYTESAITSFFGTLEPAKGVHLMLISASFCLSFFALLQFPHLSKIPALITSLLLSLNPVSVYQSQSFYVDGQLSSLLICLVSLLTLAFFKRNNYLYFLIFICSAVLMNIKLTAVVYVTLFLGGSLIFFLLHEKLEQIEKLIISSGFAYIIGIFVIGFNPYVTNTLTKGHPFYPAAGYGALDFRTPNIPQNYFDKTSPQILFLSAFSRSDLKRGPNQFSQLKLPFQFDEDELRAFRFTNAIEGGWGPLFGLSLIAAFITQLFMFSLARNHGYLSILVSLTLLILITCFANPSASLARFTPQFWLFPVLTASFALMHRPLIIRLSGLCIFVILTYNMYLIASTYYTYQFQVTQEWSEKLQLMSRSETPLVINPGEFRLSTISRFNRFNIPYSLTPDTEGCSRIFSNNIVIKCPTVPQVAGMTVDR